MNQIISFKALGRDLYATVECSCPDPKYVDSDVSYRFKTKIKLVGYNDDYFFDVVNAHPQVVPCPNCKKPLQYQWTRDGVEINTTINPVFESMTRFVNEDWGIAIRVWREHPQFTSGPDSEVLSMIHTILPGYLGRSYDRIAYKLASLTGVSAVEVLNLNGDGAVFYPDWK